MSDEQVAEAPVATGEAPSGSEDWLAALPPEAFPSSLELRFRDDIDDMELSVIALKLRALKHRKVNLNTAKEQARSGKSNESVPVDYSPNLSELGHWHDVAAVLPSG